jgi:NADP-dependent 3-hydroxy acid dehydrogenase YdfG
MNNRHQEMNRVVVITGADAGVGRATMRQFAGCGARIGLIGRDQSRLAQTADEARRLGGEALVCPADVADAAQVEAAAAAVEAAFGHIDVWINNAMATIYAPFHEIAAEDYKCATEVTYLGAVYGTMAALRRMRPNNNGIIIQVGSALAYRAIPLQSPYCGAKFAIRGFTDALRSELLHNRCKVRLTMVRLPALNTPQFEWGKNRSRCSRSRCRRFSSQKWRARPSCGPAGINGAKSTWAGQQSDQPANLASPDNLWQAVAGDFAAHGRFDRRAKPGSLQLWTSLYREPIAIGLLTAGLLACRYLHKRRHKF